jgi:hypothetical protein
MDLQQRGVVGPPPTQKISIRNMPMSWLIENSASQDGMD